MGNDLGLFFHNILSIANVPMPSMVVALSYLGFVCQMSISVRFGTRWSQYSVAAVVVDDLFENDHCRYC